MWLQVSIKIMTFFTRSRIFSLVILLLAAGAFNSCEKFTGDQTIPAYIKIDSIYFSTTLGQGTAMHKFTDAWVYVDNELVGTFELPVVLPVLKRGQHTILIQAGIKMNGIASTRVPYPFTKSYTVSTRLTEDSTTIVVPRVTYYESVVFKWLEDFELGGISMEKTSKSDTVMEKTNKTGEVCEGVFSGVVHLTDSASLFECATIKAFTLPKTGGSVFLELNYKVNNPVTVGLIGTAISQTLQEPVVVLNPNTKWNKIYINLTPTIGDMSTCYEYKVFIGALKEADVSKPEMFFDNIKLIHF